MMELETKQMIAKVLSEQDLIDYLIGQGFSVETSRKFGVWAYEALSRETTAEEEAAFSKALEEAYREEGLMDDE